MEPASGQAHIAQNLYDQGFRRRGRCMFHRKPLPAVGRSGPQGLAWHSRTIRRGIVGGDRRASHGLVWKSAKRRDPVALWRSFGSHMGYATSCSHAPADGLRGEWPRRSLRCPACSHSQLSANGPFSRLTHKPRARQRPQPAAEFPGLDPGVV